MRVYLMRHGEAVNETTDPERPMTERGTEEVAKVAKFIKKCGVRPSRVWHSTKLRALQTGEKVAEILGVSEKLEQREGLSPSDPVDGVVESIEELRGKDDEARVMIVGHMPQLEYVAAQMVCKKTEAHFLRFELGTVVCLEHVEQRGWEIVWVVTPRLLG